MSLIDMHIVHVDKAINVKKRWPPLTYKCCDGLFASNLDPPHAALIGPIGHIETLVYGAGC